MRAALLLWAAATAVYGAPLPGASLQDYLRYLEEHNPALAQAGHQVDAARARADVAEALPDPNATLGWYASEIETRVGPQKQRLSLSQALPLGGKLALRGEAAAAAADQTLAQRRAVQLKLFDGFKKHWADLYALGRELETVQQQLELLDKFTDVVDAKYRVGKATYAQFLRIEVERDRLRDRLASVRDRRNPLVSAMNALLGRAPDTPIAYPERLEAPNLGPEDLDEAELARNLQTHNPELAALARMADASSLNMALARKERIPDLRVGVDWINTGEARNPNLPGSGQDALVLNVGVNLPIWRKKQSGLEREAAARYAAAEAGQSARLDQLHAALRQALYDYREAERKIALYRDALMPRARESADVTLAAFESEQATFLDVLDADRLLLDLALSLHRAEADRFKAIAAIETLTGGALSGAEAGRKEARP